MAKLICSREKVLAPLPREACQLSLDCAVLNTSSAVDVGSVLFVQRAGVEQNPADAASPLLGASALNDPYMMPFAAVPEMPGAENNADGVFHDAEMDEDLPDAGEYAERQSKRSGNTTRAFGVRKSLVRNPEAGLKERISAVGLKEK